MQTEGERNELKISFGQRTNGHGLTYHTLQAKCSAKGSSLLALKESRHLNVFRRAQAVHEWGQFAWLPPQN